jgi:iron-sulfur cluster assembly protein
MALTLTERAAEKAREILEERGLPATAGLRFGVKGGGCSGFEYVVDLESNPRKFDMPGRNDKVFVSHGTRLLVDKKSYLYLNGIEIDWEQNQFGHAFTYNNPNAKGVCGCGISFSV